MKTWQGPTPGIISGSIGPLWNMGFSDGFKAAMNSPTVVAMYEALKTIPHSELLVAAYEAGLKEQP